MTNELKPCPFCGGAGDQVKTDINYNVVMCTKCHCETSGYTGKESAIIAWNRRPEVKQPPERITND